MAKSSFYDKSNNFDSITLIENNRIVSDEVKAINMFNGYFSNLVENLKLQIP